MHENEKLGKALYESLGQGKPVVLASIVVLEGSSPRHNGAKMLVGANGQCFGTVGGSLLEATTVKESRRAISEARPIMFEFALNGKDAKAQGMICGGKATILLDYIAANEANRMFFFKWYQAVQENRKFYYVSYLKCRDKDVEVSGRSIFFSSGETIAVGSVPESIKTEIESHLPQTKITSIVNLDGVEAIIDPLSRIKTLYCFGAGHVALPTCHIAALCGFRIGVIDDREEYACAERFPDAQNIWVKAGLADKIDELDINEDSYIVIVTRGHSFDREVLQKSLTTRAGYIGMISSRRKKEAIFNELKSQGVAEAELSRVHSPIGLPIGGETPEEIAVSIVAEMITERVKQDS
jgi:xanthine dehydrogenase accessory factor